MKQWTAEEDTVVRQWAGVKTNREIGSMVGRTKASVSSRSGRLGVNSFPVGGITKNGTPWSDEERKALRYSMSARAAMKATGRTENAVEKMAKRLGVKFMSQRIVICAPEKKVVVKTPMVRSKPTPIDKPRKVEAPYVSRLEYCPICCSPVSDWQGHYERMGHRRQA